MFPDRSDWPKRLTGTPGQQPVFLPGCFRHTRNGKSAEQKCRDEVPPGASVTVIASGMFPGLVNLFLIALMLIWRMR